MRPITLKAGLELGDEAGVEMVGDEVGTGVVAEGDHRVGDGDGAEAHADGGADADAAGKQGQTVAHRQAKGHNGGLEGLDGHADGEGRGVEDGDGVLGDAIEEFGHDVGAQARDSRDADAGLGEGPDDGAQGLERLGGVELEERGVGGGKAALDVQGVDPLGEQFTQRLANGVAIDAADEAVRVVIGDAILLQTLGEHFRGKGEATEEEGVKFKNDGGHNGGAEGWKSPLTRLEL